MSEPLSITAIVLATLTTIGGVLTGIHIKRLNSGCCECDFYKSTNSPNLSPSNLSLANLPPLRNSIVQQPVIHNIYETHDRLASNPLRDSHTIFGSNSDISSV